MHLSCRGLPEAWNCVVEDKAFWERAFCSIAQLQYEAEKKLFNSRKALSLRDTNFGLQSLEVICLGKFYCPAMVSKAIKNQLTDIIHFLTSRCARWNFWRLWNISDQSLRRKWFTLYAQTLDQYGLHYEVIDGDYTSRENMAKSLLQDWLTLH